MGKCGRWRDLLWGQGGFRGFERGLLKETPASAFRFKLSQAERYNEDDGAPLPPVPIVSSS